MGNYQKAGIVFIVLLLIFLLYFCFQRIFFHKEQEISDEELQAVNHIIKSIPVNGSSLTAYQLSEKAFTEYNLSYQATREGGVVEVLFFGFVKTNIEGSAAKRAHLSFLVNIEKSSVTIGTASGNLNWESLLK